MEFPLDPASDLVSRDSRLHFAERRNLWARHIVSRLTARALNHGRQDGSGTNHSLPSFGRPVHLGMPSLPVNVEVVITNLLDERVRKQPATQRLSGIGHPPRLPLQAALPEDDVIAVLSALVGALMPGDPEPDVAVSEIGQIAGLHARQSEAEEFTADACGVVHPPSPGDGVAHGGVEVLGVSVFEGQGVARGPGLPCRTALGSWVGRRGCGRSHAVDSISGGWERSGALSAGSRVVSFLALGDGWRT